MFGSIGIPELVLIFIVALVVFGPKKLPELGKSLGHGLREFNKAKNELKATWDEQMREAERHIEGAKDAVNHPVREAIEAIHTTGETPPEIPQEASANPADGPQAVPDAEPSAPDTTKPSAT